MTDITDQDRRTAHEWAASIDTERKCWSDRARAIARVILATVDAPALSEELRDTARWWINEAPTWEHCCDRFDALADRAKQMEWELDHISTSRDNWKTHAKQNVRELTEARAELERERDEAQSKFAEVMNARDSLREDYNHARDEVERLTSDVERITAERDRIASGRYITYAEVDGKPVQKGAESNAETPDPADVKPGEAWIVECHGERRTAVKDRGGDEPWNTVPAGGRFYPEENAAVTLVTRLVPAPRVITNPDELEALPHRTVIRDSAGVMFQRIVHGWYQAGDTSVHRSDDNFVCLPVTVLWEPEA